jgi:TonB family protein
VPEPSQAVLEEEEERQHKSDLDASFHLLDASLKPEHTKDTKISLRARRCLREDGVDCRAMKRVVWTFVIGCAFGVAAMAQEHKISVQKFEAPKYPEIARQARVMGQVKLALEVAADGRVSSVTVQRGHPLLNQAAVDNVKLWRFYCDDCGYGQAFHHEFIVGFSLGDSDCTYFLSATYEFPNTVTLKRNPVCIETIASK